MNPKFGRWGYEFLQSSLTKLPYGLQMFEASHKTMSFLKVWRYLSTSKIYGDYLEFGVFEGSAFKLALNSARKMFNPDAPVAPRFFAFDSFQGLPSIDKDKDATNIFSEHTLACSEDDFRRNIRKTAKGAEVYTVPGFFNESLTPEIISRYKIECAAFVNIDCDLFDSTLSALRFVTPLLKTGSVIYFDDWHLSGGDMRRGEPGACAQWCKENPGISLHDFGDSAFQARLFIVNS